MSNIILWEVMHMKKHKILILNSLAVLTVVLISIQLLDLFKFITIKNALSNLLSDLVIVLIGTLFYSRRKNKFALAIIIIGLFGCALALIELLL